MKLMERYNMKKIMTIFGTRPEAVKMAPLVQALKETDHLQPVVVVSAQHREMLDGVLNTFNIKPDFDLDIMQQGQTLSDINSSVLMKLYRVNNDVRTDMFLVLG